MGEFLLLMAAFVAGGLLGAGLTWWFIRRSRPGARPAADVPPRSPESEVSQLATASRQLMAELETRYQGRTAADEAPKRPPAKRAPAKRRPRSR